MKKTLIALLTCLLVLSLVLAGCAHTHDFSEEWTSDAEKHWHECTAGDGERSDEGAHIWNDGTVTVQPTEQSTGTKVYQCTVCGATKTETLAKLDHTHVYGELHAAVAATCTKKGNVAYYHCEGCGKYFDEDKEEIATIETEMIPHSWNDGEVTKPATCQEEGVKTFTCSVCQTTRTETLAVTDHTYGDLIAATAATCTETGTAAHYQCSVCHKYFDENKEEIATITTDALGHNFEKSASTAATTSEEGSVTFACTRCDVTETYKTLKVPATTFAGDVVRWNEVANATGYKVYVDDNATDVGTVRTYTLPADALEHSYAVAAYTTDEAYYGESTNNLVLTLADEDLQQSFNGDFEKEVAETLKLDRIGGWNYYPYGNWSDTNSSGVGGWYYIMPDTDGNMVIKLPAVVWASGNTTVKKDLSANCTAVNTTFEVSFDIKASERSLTANNNGAYGALAGYMWDGAAHGFEFIGSRVVKDIANTETWSNVRARYTVGETAGTFAQFNLIYWPEGSVGEDNYVLIDNIKVYKVVDGVAVENNIDSEDGGDLEMFSQTVFTSNRWYRGDTLLIEGSALGSRLVTETTDNGTNKYLKLYSPSGKDAEFDLHGDLSLAEGGIYKMTMKVKKSVGATNLTDIGFTLWAWNAAAPNKAFRMADNTFFTGVSDIGSDKWTTLETYFVTNAYEGTQTINIFFWVTLHNDTLQSENNYVLIDDITVQKVSISHEAHTLVWRHDDTEHWHECEAGDAGKQDVAAHVWNDGEVTTAATCKEEGVKTFTCTVCGATRTETVAVTDDHDYGDLIAATAATCTAKGTVAHYQCSVCNKYFDESKNEISDIETDMIPHSWNDGEVTTPATCQAEGVKTFTCTVCQTTKTEAVEKTDHTYGDLIAATPATCTETGTVAHYECSVCNKYFNADKEEIAIITTPALGHEWIVDEENSTAATTENEGTVVLKCERECGVANQTRKALKLPDVSVNGTTLTWTAVDNATGYEVEIGGVATDIGNVTTYTLTQAAGEYSCKIIAYTTDEAYYGKSASVAVTVTVPED